MLLDRSLAMRRKALGPDHPSVAESLHHQAELLKELVRAARIFRETSCVGVGRRVVSAQVDLSLTLSVLATQGKYAEAESLFERSQALREKVFGLEHPDVAQSLYHRAEVLENQVSLEKTPDAWCCTSVSRNRFHYWSTAPSQCPAARYAPQI